MNQSRIKYKPNYQNPVMAIFAGENDLDFLELRLGVIRIPEVSRRVWEAQSIIDGLPVEPMDLFCFLQSPDDVFFKNEEFRILLSAVVQIGLFDRYIQTSGMPSALLGKVQETSALLVCSGQKEFRDLVESSAAVKKLAPKLHIVSVFDTDAEAASTPASKGLDSSAAKATTCELPVSGYYLPLEPIAAKDDHQQMRRDESAKGENVVAGEMFQVFFRTDVSALDERAHLKSFESGPQTSEIKKLLVDLIEHQQVFHFVNIGPNDLFEPVFYKELSYMLGAPDITMINSVDLDPMLNWFWSDMQPFAAVSQ